MIRRFGFVVLVTALIVSACGRQVTPDRTPGAVSNLDPGFMSVKFRVAQPFNFSQYSYMVVFNTSGDGSTPHANGQQNNYRGYSFALVVSGATGSVQVQAYQYYRPQNAPGYQQPTLQPLFPTPQQLQLIPNSNGQNTEFTIVFQRSIFLGIASVAPSAAPTATATVSASPTASPTGSASPSPLPTGFATTWQFNYFTATGTTYLPVDSLGSGGATDTSYASPNLDTTTQFDTQSFYAAPPVAPPSDPAAQITGGDIANNP